MEDRLEGLELRGELPCLDFVNTVDWRPTDHASDRLGDYDDLVRWSLRAGLLDERRAKGLRTEAHRQPDEAQRVFDRAVALRETIYRLALSIIHGTSPKQVDAEELNGPLEESAVHLRLVPKEQGLLWTWRGDDSDLRWPLWLLARCAADLFTSESSGRIRQCAGPDCGWLFLDRSRNRSRRWCDMADCGNREKARRHREKQLASRGRETGKRSP
jgi:predicted RNA-binding Zn ribbon-like protein